MQQEIIRRALELAAESTSTEEVRLKLLREGHFNVAGHIRHPSIRREIADRLK